jgi:two-component system response regulator HydG
MSITNILVVDDDIMICRIVQRMLSDEHYHIQMSQSVADAFVAIEKSPFDVYVMDYKLPDGSGLDIAERIRLKCGTVPIILISGYDPTSVALRAEKLSIDEFLEKPFSRDAIRKAVEKAIGTPAAAAPAILEAESVSQAQKPRPKGFLPRLAEIKGRWRRTK